MCLAHAMLLHLQTITIDPFRVGPQRKEACIHRRPTSSHLMRANMEIDKIREIYPRELHLRRIRWRSAVWLLHDFGYL